MKAVIFRLALLSLVSGMGVPARGDTLIAAGLSAADFAADFNTTNTGAGPSTVNRWEAVFGKTAANGTPGAVYTAVWDRGATPGPNGIQIQPAGGAGSADEGGCSRFMLREGTWIAARDEEGGQVIATVGGTGAPEALRTPCTPVDSCADSPCEEINLNWSLGQTTDSGGTTRTVLLYSDWYYREGEEATLLARLDPVAGCEGAMLLDQPLAQHEHICGAEGDDSFWLVSLDTAPGGSPQLRYTRLPRGLAGAALSSGILSVSMGSEGGAGADGTAAARHAVDADGAAVRAVWVDAQGVALGDLLSGDVTRIASASGAPRRPVVAVSATTVTAAWETDSGVEVWRDGNLESIAGATVPRLEKDGSGGLVLFYTKPATPGGATWSLYARELD